MNNTDESKRRRRGPAPLDATDKRRHTVSVRLNDAELARLDSQRDAVQMQRGEYLRAAALHRLPPTIPAMNREQWAELARTAANLNQIARHLNEGLRGDGERIGKALGLQLSAELANCLRVLMLVRCDLIGVKHDAEDVEDESEG
ncbi:hypothetical protein PSX32_21110 [Shigella flexneri]|jgi:hypothetical protein|nr:hypothetical protein [Shigella flexneri]